MRALQSDVFVVADINIDTIGAEVTLEEGTDDEIVENIEIEFNANENPDGVSLIDTYGLHDALGMKFWYNNVKNDLLLSVSIVGNYKLDENNKLISVSDKYADALISWLSLANLIEGGLICLKDIFIKLKI